MLPVLLRRPRQAVNRMVRWAAGGLGVDAVSSFSLTIPIAGTFALMANGNATSVAGAAIGNGAVGFDSVATGATGGPGGDYVTGSVGSLMNGDIVNVTGIGTTGGDLKLTNTSHGNTVVILAKNGNLSSTGTIVHRGGNGGNGGALGGGGGGESGSPTADGNQGSAGGGGAGAGGTGGDGGDGGSGGGNLSNGNPGVAPGGGGGGAGAGSKTGGAGGTGQMVLTGMTSGTGLNGPTGQLIDIPIKSITQGAGGKALVTTIGPHGQFAGLTATISGTSVSGYNQGSVTISAAGSDTILTSLAWSSDLGTANTVLSIVVVGKLVADAVP